MKRRALILFMVVLTGLFSGINLSAQQVIKLQRNRNISNRQPQKEKLAQAYYFHRQFDKAAELFKELYHHKQNYYYYTYYLNSLINLRNFDEAVRLTKAQSRKHPRNYRYQIDYAYVLNGAGNTKKAQRILQKIINKLPNDRSSIIQIANALQSKGYAKMAINVYEKASQMPNSNYSYNLERANAYRLTGDYDKMFDAYMAYLKDKPKEVQLIKNRLQNILMYDVDNNLKGIIRTKLLQRVQQNPDNFAYNDLLLWLSMQTRDFEMAFRQARAIDRRFGNHEEAVYSLAKIALSNKKYNMAVKAYGYLKKKGEHSTFYAESYTGWILTKMLMAKNNPHTTTEEYRTLEEEGDRFIAKLGIHSETAEAVLQLARIKAFYLNKPAEAETLLKKTIAISQLKAVEKAKAKLLLGDVLLYEKKIWDASLYYSQVELNMNNEPLGHQAKFKNAMLFYYEDEFEWAQARLDILKAATSKLISNDAIEMSMFMHDVLQEDTLGFSLRKFAAADLLFAQHQPDSAMMWLQKIEKNPSGPVSMQFALYKEAAILKSEQRYREADSVYAQLVQQYPESIKADNALFAEAKIKQEHLGETEEAKKLYLQLMKQYPESIFSNEARERYRKMTPLQKGQKEAKNGTP